MKSKLKELRELIFKCEEVKKDVLELKFGCKIKIGEKEETLISYSYYLDECRYLIKAKSNEEAFRFNIKEKDLEIIGRDITLFDIKYCLVYNKTTDKDFIEIANLWNYPNSLSNQSEELLTLIYEKLKNKTR